MVDERMKAAILLKREGTSYKNHYNNSNTENSRSKKPTELIQQQYPTTNRVAATIIATSNTVETASQWSCNNTNTTRKTLF